MERQKKSKENTVLVSFKVAKDIYKKIEEYAKTQTSEIGVQLSPSLAARRLMLESLDRKNK